MLISHVLAEATQAPQPASTAAAVGQWAVVGPLVGALLVAVVGAISIQVANSIQNRRERRAKLTEVRREQYFKGIEAAGELRDAAMDFGVHNSGRIDAADALDDEQRVEMETRDQDAAAAAGRLQLEFKNLQRVAVLVEAVGSFGVATAMRDVLNRTGRYMSDLVEDMPVFKANTFNAFSDDYSDLFDVLVSAIRADLEVDKLFIAKSNASSQ